MSDASYGSGPMYPPSTPNGPLATWGQRVIAYLIEVAFIVGAVIVLIIITAILSAVSHVLATLVAVVGYIALALSGLYFAYLNGLTGQSPGKRLTGLKTISEVTGQPIGGGQGIVRALCHIADGIICDIGFLLPLWDRKRQTIADKIMKTVVVTGAPTQSFGPNLFK